MRTEPHISAISRRPDATIVASDTFTLMKVPPEAELTGLVREIALYRETAGRTIQQVETASLVIPLLIGFSDPFSIALGRDPSRDDDYHSFTAGLSLRPVNILSAGASSCVEVTLTPLGARRLFGMPMSELSDRMVHLDALGDRALERLRQQLGNERDWDERLAIVEAFILKRMRDGPSASAQTGWAYDRIVRSGGGVTVAGLAEKLGWSRKHLAKRFHDDVGLPPKAVARIARFMRTQAMASAEREAINWASMAAAGGYADQSHLVREFRALSGSTPTEWLARQRG